METVVTAARQSPLRALCSHQYHSFCGLCCETLNKKQQYCVLLCTTNRQLHPAESSENTSICAKIRKYVPIDCLWQMFS